MQVYIALPPDLLTLTGLLSPARAAQHVLRLAMDDDLSPVPCAAGSRACPVYLTPDVYAGLMDRGACVDEIGHFAAGLIEAWATDHRTTRRVRDPDPLDDLPADRLRPVQRQLAAQVLPSLHAGKIAFCEASTGIGKSWVIALCAESARRAGQRVQIAAPSLAVLTQLVDAFHRLDLVPPLPLLGRAQFIDPARLQEVIELPDLLPDVQREALRSWDGRPLQEGVLAPLVRMSGALAWLREDALTLAPDLPIELVRFQSDEEITAHQAQRELAREAPIICTTHAMIAADMRLRSLGHAILPDTGWLILDEAHLFEETVAQTFSDGVSVLSLRHQLKKIPLELAKAKRIAAAIDRILEITERWMADFASVDGRSFLFGTGSHPSDGNSTVEQVLREGAARLLPDMKRIARAQLPELDCNEAIRALEGVKRLSAPASLTLSPVRRFPTIHVGHRGVRKNLEALWDRVHAAMLVSATLYVETQEHGYSAGFLGGRLSIPPTRCTEIPPVVAPWLYTGAELHLPGAAGSTHLVPPTPDEFAGITLTGPEVDYYDALASIAMGATQDAKGGTLVLCTSYRAVSALKDRLSHALSDRLIVQTPGLTLNAMRSRFRTLYDNGARPVWIATGAAGTGLDLRDERVPPAEDQLLTDLIITRLPLLPPTTLVGQLRRSRMGMSASRLELVFMFRQWLGRAVRAEGQPVRRIWVCDGRLQDHQSLYLTGPCRRLLAKYPRTSPIPEFRPAHPGLVPESLS